MMNKPKLKSGKATLSAKRKALGLRRPNLKRRHTKNAEERMADAFNAVPRITNETVSEHREDVLKSARKYIYPLEHSKHRLVRISLALLVLFVVILFSYCSLSLYKFQSTNSFIYAVTRVIPFPVAKAGPRYISYESYLFELRRDIHYYQTQQQANFNTKDGKAQLVRLKQQVLQQVTQDAYVKELAQQHHVTISDQAVNDEVALVRDQNRLGSNDRVFKDVLNQFWGWSEADFKRELQQQLLQQAVVTNLDTATSTRAQSAYKQLQAGADFGTVAGQVSEDPTTKANGGTYPTAITITDRDLAPQVTNELFKLKPGIVSPVTNTGYTLEILKVTDRSGSSLHAAHIQFNLQDISIYIKPLTSSQPVHKYIKF